VLTDQHVARLGGELFGRHLIAVEVAGTLLLVALVGAAVIVAQGREERGSGFRVQGSASEVGSPASPEPRTSNSELSKGK
jgi:hypothetical protein